MLYMLLICFVIDLQFFLRNYCIVVSRFYFSIMQCSGAFGLATGGSFGLQYVLLVQTRS